MWQGQIEDADFDLEVLASETAPTPGRWR